MRLEQIGGRLSAIAVRDTVCYAGIGTRLVLFDLAAPYLAPVSAPPPPLPAFIHAIAVAPPYACLAAGRAGLYVADCADPAAPRIVGGWQGPHAALGVDVDADRCYLTCADGHIVVLDLRDPARPTPLGPGIALPGPHGRLDQIVAVGGVACVAVYGGVVMVLDLRDPGRPAIVARHEMGGSRLARSGTKAYALGRRLYRLDLRAPGVPEQLILPDLPYSWTPCALAVAPPDAWLGIWTDGVPPGSAGDGRLRWSGLWHMDLRTLAALPPPRDDEMRDAAPRGVPSPSLSPSPPPPPGMPPPDSWTLDNPPQTIATADGIVAVHISDNTLLVAEVNATPPPWFAPRTPRRYRPPDVGGMVAADERYGYAIRDGKPLVLGVLDLHAGLDAAPLGECLDVPTAPLTRSAALHDGHLYLAHDDHGLAIFAVHDPARPMRLPDVQIGAWNERPTHLATADGLLYALGPLPRHDGRRLSVYDLAEPGSPRLISRALLPGIPDAADGAAAKGLAIVGGHAAVLTRDDALGLYALDDPAAARLVGTCTLAQEVLRSAERGAGIAALGARVYAPRAVGPWRDAWMNTHGELRVVNVRDPARPRVEESIPLPGKATEIAAGGGRLYVSCGLAGIQILDLTG